MKKQHIVGVYANGHWLGDIHFFKKWQARLFHFLLGKSKQGAGVRNY